MSDIWFLIKRRGAEVYETNGEDAISVNIVYAPNPNSPVGEEVVGVVGFSLEKGVPTVTIERKNGKLNVVQDIGVDPEVAKSNPGFVRRLLGKIRMLF